MPTARELLDQADALMRRNRKRGKDRMGDVPTLTDAFDPRAASIAPTLILPDNMAADPIVLDHAVAQASPPEPSSLAEASPPAEALDPMSLDTLGDVPVLTDAVLDWPDATKPLETREPVPATSDAPVDAGDAFPASAQEAEAAAAELPPPAVLEREAPEETPGPASEPAQEQPTSATTARVPFLDDDFILEIPPQEQGAAQPAPPPAPIVDASMLTAGSREWDALAEEIRMQVLQRLDLFTDTGLREQLGARLAPIVERASAQLIETINRELGELVRGYVAEAIEREIDSWRNQQPKS
jgi:hypothetical protein